MKLEDLTELMKDVLENRGFTEEDIERFENISELRKFLQNLNSKKWRMKNRSYTKEYNELYPEKSRIYARRHYYKKLGRNTEMPSL
jgi:hypothetical protein